MTEKVIKDDLLANPVPLVTTRSMAPTLALSLDLYGLLCDDMLRDLLSSNRPLSYSHD